MRLPAPSINLLRDQEKSFFEKLISWSLNIGRLLLIITECLALAVFLYRFKLDRDIVDLHDEIERQQTFVRLLESREKDYRNLEQRLSVANTLLTATPQATVVTKDILNQADDAILVSQFALSPTSFHIEGRAISLDKVRVFIEYLKTYPNVTGVSVDRIENKTTTASLEISISADFKVEEKKQMEDRRRFLQNLAKRRYLAMAQYLPKISKEKIQEYSALILTLIALIVFGLFAINPTLTTVIELRKQLEDSEFAVERLKTKVTNLNALSQQYQTIQPDLPILLEALPQSPSPSVLLGQINVLAAQEGVTLLTLDSSEITLYPPLTSTGKEASFIFTLTVQGNYTSLLTFMDSLVTFNRLVKFESISYLKPERESSLPRLSIRGRAYFLP